MDRVAELANRPTRAELHDAEERVVAAQVALERVRAEPPPVVDESDPGAYDRVALEKSLEQDRSQVATLEQQLSGMTLRAPFAGIVSSLQVRPGDPVDRGVQVLAIARPGDPIVNADVNRDDAARITIGQRATVQGEGAATTPLEATVIGLIDGPAGVGQTAQLKVAWQQPPPAYGAAVQALVTVLEKNNVLLIPQRAVRSSGQRRYVEYMEGDARRTVDVSLGIAGGGEVEVLSGLREGQIILAGTVTATATATPGAASPVPASLTASPSVAPVPPR
jgi:multidrug efflux pump subunit AcrA (membrane-fusion protein)